MMHDEIVKKLTKTMGLFASVQAWPGWDQQETPVCFFKGGEWALLFGHPTPPEEFKTADYAGLGVYLAEPCPDYLMANTAQEIGGVQTATVMYHDFSNLRSYAALTLHEAFHAYQNNNGFPSIGIEQLELMVDYPLCDATVNALGRLEAANLHQALKGGSNASDLLRQALDCRHARQALLPEHLRPFEDKLEIVEGLASYVEMKLLIPGDTRWEENMEKLTQINVKGAEANRGRFYVSGMAYGLALDLVAPGWQLEWMEGFPSLSSFLAHKLNHVPEKAVNSMFESAVAQQVLEEEQLAEKEAKTRQTEALGKAFPGSGTTVEVTINLKPDGMQAIGFHPYNMMILPGKQRLHPQVFQIVTTDGEELRVQGPCLETELLRTVRLERPEVTVEQLANGYYSLQAEGVQAKTKTPPVINGRAWQAKD